MNSHLILDTIEMMETLLAPAAVDRRRRLLMCKLERLLAHLKRAEKKRLMQIQTEKASTYLALYRRINYS